MPKGATAGHWLELELSWSASVEASESEATMTQIEEVDSHEDQQSTNVRNHHPRAGHQQLQAVHKRGPEVRR